MFACNNKENQEFRKLMRAFPHKAILLLHDAAYNKLLTIAIRLTQNPTIAEDIVQETFMYVWENWESLSEPHEKPIQLYLLKIVKNKARSHFRSQSRRQMNNLQTLNGYPAHDSPEERLIKKQTAENLRKLISTFPEKEKSCLHFKIDNDMSVDQMATELHVTKKAVERSLTNAYKRIRKQWPPYK